jgi:hypothetical protein
MENVCNNCSWSWDIESDDDKPYLCHKCGYDNKLGRFDMVSFNRWKSLNDIKDFIKETLKEKGLL